MVMFAQNQRSGGMIPRAVVVNLIKLNLLLLLVVVCTVLGLRLHLEPRAWPVTTNGEITPGDGDPAIHTLWTMETGAARNLLHQGIPLLKVRNGPQTLFQRPRGFFKEFFRCILEVDPVSLFSILWKELTNI